jgi:hypothetical protein
MTELQLIEALHSRGLKPDLADNGAVLCEFPELGNYGLGISIMGAWLDCYAYESYAGSDLGIAGHSNLDEAIAWALLLIVSCEARMSAELATMKREI